MKAFQNLITAMIHLDQSGFKISKSKIYRDKDKNFIKVEPDGTVLESEIRAYASTLERKDGGSLEDLNDVHLRKANKDVELRDLKIKRMQFDLDKERGLYIERKLFEAELAARAMVFESGFRHTFTMHLREWVAMVGGRLEKEADFLQALNHALDSQLSGYASTQSYQVMFSKEAE